MKACSKCFEIKPFDCFGIRNASWDGYAFVCKAEYGKFYYAVAKDRLLRDRKVRAEKNKDIISAQNRQRYLDNKEKVKARVRRYREANLEKVKQKSAEYRARKAEHIKAIQRAYQKRKWQKIAIASRQRRLKNLKAVPPWVDHEAIDAFYVTAEGMGMLTGEWHHVDHIVPINSPLVCGLHCAANMQVLTGYENRSKGNRWWPDMPGS